MVTPAADDGWPEAERFVEAFESAWARDGAADLVEFAPPAGHPDRARVLCELVRVDMEYRWERGEPRRLADYERLVPELFHDRQRAREVAYEEFRLRRLAGEEPTADEYRERLGEEPAWVVSRVAAGGDGAAAGPLPWAAAQPPSEGLERTASAYLSLGRNGPGDPLAKLAGAAARREHLDLFRDIRAADPDAADRLAEALAAMPEPGQDFVRFRLGAELGRGAFGRVFLARQGDLADRPVALKVAPDVAGESRALAQLQHTNVVPIYSVHRSGPFQAVCMPYLGSVTLADVLRRIRDDAALPDSGRALLSTLDECRSRVPGSEPSPPADTPEARPGPSGAPSVEERPTAAGSTAQLEHLGSLGYVEAVLWLGSRLADGLAHAHDRGILHRDLKPANVLFTDDGEPMLLDFNLAADLKLRDCASAALIGGTLPYMAPEHLEACDGRVPAADVDARADVYSLGVVLFELLSGRHPFPIRRGPVHAIVPAMIEDRRGPAPRLRGPGRSVTPAVESIVRMCLAAEPAARYQSARQLREDLRRQLEDLPLRYAPEPSPRERARKWARRHPRLTSSTTVALVALAAVVGLGAGLLAMRSRLERSRAEASYRQLRDEVRRAEFLLSDPDADRGRIDEGIALCGEVLGRYHVLDDHSWSGRPLVGRLPAADRPELRRELGELLTLWAGAEASRAEAAPGGRREALGHADRLLATAEATYRPGEVPRALVLVRARVARLDGREDEARRLQERADTIPLAAPVHRLLLVPGLLDRGQLREALAVADEATREAPLSPAAWLLRATCLARLDQPARAADCYRVGLGLEPDLAWARFDRGVLALEQRDFGQALADFDHVLARRPEMPEALLNRALARLGLGDAAGAVRDLDRLLERPDAPTRALFIRARAHDALGDVDAARKDREEGLRREPGDETSWVARGVARLPGDPRRALADFDAALRLNPRSRDAWRNRAHVLSELLGKTGAAIESLDRAIRHHPASTADIISRGVLRARLGRRAEAVGDVEAALALDDGAATLYQAADVFALTSTREPADRAQALRLLAMAVRKDPSWLAQVPTDPDLAPLRDRPEFRTLIEALALVRDAGGDPTPAKN